MEQIVRQNYRVFPRLKGQDIQVLREEGRRMGRIREPMHGQEFDLTKEELSAVHSAVAEEMRNPFRALLYDLGFNNQGSSSAGYSTFTRSWNHREEYLVVMMSPILKNGRYIGFKYTMGLSWMEDTTLDNYSNSGSGVSNADNIGSKEVTFDDLYDMVEEEAVKEEAWMVFRGYELLGIKATSQLV